jgi:hypothetical protein
MNTKSIGWPLHPPHASCSSPSSRSDCARRSPRFFAVSRAPADSTGACRPEENRFWAARLLLHGRSGASPHHPPRRPRLPPAPATRAGATSWAGSASWPVLRCSSSGWRCRSTMRRCSWLWRWGCGVGGTSSMRRICHEVGRGKLRGPSTGVPIDAPGVGPSGVWLDLPA